ncbi:hypothetical protein [Fodinicola acaciae]|nr:hypothetical protein [Fodinicola acaciae]
MWQTFRNGEERIALQGVQFRQQAELIWFGMARTAEEAEITEQLKTEYDE